MLAATPDCTSKYDVGEPCQQKATRYYYERTTNTCRTFWYFGCGGNGNNYFTQELCEKACKAAVASKSSEVNDELLVKMKKEMLVTGDSLG